jgi:hypothetical protein
MLLSQVFEAHLSSPHAITDTTAWNALAKVHAERGVMTEAALAAARATEVAASQV